jgi:hypothetical protein
MESDWLAERDRARRLRQQRRAKTQLVVLVTFVLLSLALVGVRYQTQEHPEPEQSRKSDEPKSKGEVSAVSEVSKHESVKTRVHDQPSSIPRPEIPSPRPLPPPEIKAADATPSPPSDKECYAALDAFLKATDLESRRKLAIEKPGLLDRMKQFYEFRNGSHPAIGSSISSGTLNIGLRAYNSLTFQSQSSPTSIGRASFVRGSDGTPKLDWESFVGWSQVDLLHLMEARKPDVTLLRVYVSKDDYHNYEFTDTQKFSSYRLRNADGSLAINGFVEQGSPTDSALLSRFDEAEAALRSQSVESSKVWLPLTVRVKFPPQASSDHCVHLTEVVEARWLLPEEPAN